MYPTAEDSWFRQSKRTCAETSLQLKRHLYDVLRNREIVPMAKLDSSPDSERRRLRLCVQWAHFIYTCICASILPTSSTPLSPGAYPTVPVFLRWQAVLTWLWKCSLSCRQASGVYHYEKTDRQTCRQASRPSCKATSPQHKLGSIGA